MPSISDIFKSHITTSQPPAWNAFMPSWPERAKLTVHPLSSNKSLKNSQITSSSSITRMFPSTILTPSHNPNNHRPYLSYVKWLVDTGNRPFFLSLLYHISRHTVCHNYHCFWTKLFEGMQGL